MSKFKVCIYPGKRPHFVMSLSCFDKDAIIESNSDPIIIETKMTEKELESLTSVKAVTLLSPPIVFDGFSIERFILDVFNIPKNNKIVKLKDLDSEVTHDLVYQFEFHKGIQNCLIDKTKMYRTDLESFFNDCMSKQGTSTQTEIKIIVFNIDTSEYHQILSNSIDSNYVYLEFRNSISYKY